MIFDHADVWINDRWFAMQSIAQNQFAFHEIEVRVNDQGQVFVQGDQNGIYGVKLVQNHALEEDALVLGDAWERAYGDLQWERPDEQKQLP